MKRLIPLIPPAAADIISPGEILLDGLGRVLPAVLVVVLLIVTALLVRHFTKRK